MAYFYNNSNYSEIPDNYHYYQYYYNHDYPTNYDPRYVNYYDTQYHENAYQHAPTQPLVGYYYSNYSQPESLTSKNAVFHGINDYYNEPVSTEYVVYHNTTTNGEATTNNVEVEKSDDVFEEYNPQPFHGGYDINEKYGKPMSPNEKICYPKDEKVDPNNNSTSFSYGAVPSPYVKDDKKVVESEANGVAPKEVIHEEDASDFDNDEDEDDDYDDDDDDDYEDDEDGVDEGDKKGEEKKDDLGKDEAAKGAAVVAALGAGAAALNKKEEQNLERVAKPKDGGNGNNASEVIQEKKASDFEAVQGEEEEDDNEEKGEEKQGVLVDNKQPNHKTIIPIAPLNNDGKNGKGSPNIENEAKPKNGSVGVEVIKEQPPSNFEHEKEEIKGTKEEDEGTQIRRQIPPGYGMEALDICEGLFGGYFPCLWKRKQGNNNNINNKINTDTNNVNQQGGYYDNMSDYDYCCKETVDYLFGNPNPYGGTMPEKGSYGDPIYSYQRYYPQQPVTEQVGCYGGNSSLMHHVPKHYYGYNNGGY